MTTDDSDFLAQEIDFLRDELLSIKGEMDTIEVEIAKIKEDDPTDLGTLEILEFELKSLEKMWNFRNERYMLLTK